MVSVTCQLDRIYNLPEDAPLDMTVCHLAFTRTHPVWHLTGFLTSWTVRTFLLFQPLGWGILLEYDCLCFFYCCCDKSRAREKGLIWAYRSRVQSIVVWKSRNMRYYGLKADGHICNQEANGDGCLCSALSLMFNRSQDSSLGNGVTHSGQVFLPR